MNQPRKPTILELFADNDLIDQAMKVAVRKALLQHKQAGNPVADWQNGMVVWLPPEQIPVDDDLRDGTSQRSTEA